MTSPPPGIRSDYYTLAPHKWYKLRKLRTETSVQDKQPFGVSKRPVHSLPSAHSGRILSDRQVRSGSKPEMTIGVGRVRPTPPKAEIHRGDDLVRFEPKATSSDLFEHLVGMAEQRRWHFDAERPRGLEIDGHLKPSR